MGAEDDSWSIIEPLMIVSLDSMPKKPKAVTALTRRSGRGREHAGKRFLEDLLNCYYPFAFPRSELAPSSHEKLLASRHRC